MTSDEAGTAPAAGTAAEAAGRPALTVGVHQPDFLPWSGYFHKMAVSDHWIIAHNYQFQKHGMMRRVTMRGSWVTLPLVGKGALVPMNTLQVQPGWQELVVRAIEGRYRSARYYRERAGALIEGIRAVNEHRLDKVNVALLQLVRPMLGITTPMTYVTDSELTAADRLVHELSLVGATRYVSGNGARDYLGEKERADFAAAGIELVFSDHENCTSDSIVTVLMDCDDPRACVLRRKGS